MVKMCKKIWWCHAVAVLFFLKKKDTEKRKFPSPYPTCAAVLCSCCLLTTHKREWKYHKVNSRLISIIFWKTISQLQLNLKMSNHDMSCHLLKLHRTYYYALFYFFSQNLTSKMKRGSRTIFYICNGNVVEGKLKSDYNCQLPVMKQFN